MNQLRRGRLNPRVLKGDSTISKSQTGDTARKGVGSGWGHKVAMLPEKISSTSAHASLARTNHMRPTELQPEHYVPQRDKLGVDQQKAAINNPLRPRALYQQRDYTEC